MAQPTYGNKWPEYAKQWDAMQVRPGRVKEFERIAQKILSNKTRYQAAEKTTGVPWFMIGSLHERESSQNFNTQLAQGDPLNRVSTHIPKGRGPFSTWEEGALDALVTLKGFNKVVDWRLEKILYYSELYNGWGYHNRGVPSAYVWAGSTIYLRGKYVSDGVWSATAADTQVGIAPLIKTLADMDKSIVLKRETKFDGVGTSAGTSTGGIATTVTTTDPSNWWWIIPTVVVGGIVIGFVVRWYKNRQKEKEALNVVQHQAEVAELLGRDEGVVQKVGNDLSGTH